MKSKTTKTLIAATMAALAVPSGALATGPGHDKHADKHADKADRKAQRSDDRGDRGEKRGHGKARKAFVLSGVDASGLSVTDGELTGAITLDPTSANRGARTLLDLTKTKLAGTDTVTFGAAGDAVVVKYRGLTATDTLQPTDRVKIHGKVRGGVLDIRWVKITRPSVTPEQPAPTSPQG